MDSPPPSPVTSPESTPMDYSPSVQSPLTSPKSTPPQSPPYAIDEPKTLSEQELNALREAAQHIINTHTPEEATRIFMEGLIAVDGVKLPNNEDGWLKEKVLLPNKEDGGLKEKVLLPKKKKREEECETSDNVKNGS